MLRLGKNIAKYFVLLSRNNPFKISQSKNYSNVLLPAKMEKIYGMHRLVGLQLFLSGTPIFSSGTPTFCQMGVLNSCFQNPSESSAYIFSHFQVS